MQKRVQYFDYLKLVSCILIVLIHVISEVWYQLPVKSASFIVTTIFDGLFRWTVPIYFMISGAIFLDENKEMSLKKIYKKNILKMFIIFIIWAIIYGFILLYLYGDFSKNGILNELIFIIKGHGRFHLWFLLEMIAFYICVPFIRLITKKENKKILIYAITILIIFNSLIPTLNNLFNAGINYSVMFTGYLHYFLLGYYINSFNIKHKKITYIIGILCALITSIGTLLISFKLNNEYDLLYNYSSIFVVFTSIAVFLFMKEKFNKPCSNEFIKQLVGCYFGVYLIHGLVIGFYEKILDIDVVSINLGQIFILYIIVLFTSYIVVYLLKKVPIVKKLFEL